MINHKTPPYTPRLSERRVEDNTELVADVLAVSKAMWADPDIRAIFERVTNKLEMTEDERGRYSVFLRKFFVRSGAKEPLDASLSAQVLRGIAAGVYESLESDDLYRYLKQQCRFR